MSDKQYDIVVVVEGVYINPEKTDWYVDQVLLEQKLILDALVKQGLSVKKVAWDDPNFDWSSTKSALIRETWDYFNRFEEFSEWLKMVKDKTKLINPFEQIWWNIDKHYLEELESKGIAVVPSYFREIDDKRTLREIHNDIGWVETVIKPVVSGGARHTHWLNPGNYDQVDLILGHILNKEAFMIQPFMEQIKTKGEVSHMVFDGEYSHSILKKAKEGDYRVQDDFGGSVESYEASESEIAYAIEVAKACDPLPIYARVDVVWDNEDELALGEIELIEPELWMREKPESADIFAAAIYKRYFQ